MSDHGLILRADLGTGHISSEVVPEHLRRQYIGGEGVNSWLLLLTLSLWS